MALWGTPRGAILSAARRLAPFLVAWIATALLWPAFMALHGLPFDVQGGAFSAASVAGADLGRWSAIRPYVVTHIQERGAVIVASAVVSLAGALLVRGLRRALAFVWLAYAGHVSFLLLVFLSTRQDLAWHLSTAFGRLAYQGTFLPALGAAIALPGVGGALLEAWRARDPGRSRERSGRLAA